MLHTQPFPALTQPSPPAPTPTPFPQFLRGTRLQPIFFAVTLIGTALHASQIILVERWNSAMG